MAGLDTVGNTTPALVDTELKDPGVQAAVLKEVDELFASGPVGGEARMEGLTPHNGGTVETIRL